MKKIQFKNRTKEMDELIDKFLSIKKIEEPVIEPEIDLDKKVNKFLDKYYNSLIEDGYKSIAASETTIMKNLIEKIAVWYEITYPDIAINSEFPKEYVDIHSFLTSLPEREKNLLRKPKIGTRILYLKRSSYDFLPAHLHISRNGVVEEAEGIRRFTESRITEEELVGLKLDAVVELLKKANINIEDSELMTAVDYHKKAVVTREKMLDTIMYRIIERGMYYGAGAKRAYIFAKDFGRDINIPVKYASPENTKSYREFINTYIKDGGSLKIECYDAYYSQKEKAITSPLKDVMINSNRYPYNTDEEMNLYQRLVDVLALNSDPEKAEKESVKQLRIERKLNKNR